MKTNVLYVFGGEKAQGAEVVIERLMQYNADRVNAHLFIAPGRFASGLINSNKPYVINVLENLKKLNRSRTGILKYFAEGISKYWIIPVKVYRYIIKNKIDVIHANTIVQASYLIPLLIYSKLFLRSRKWIWSDHDIDHYSDIEPLLSAICVRLYDDTLVVSNAVKQKFSKLEKVTVLYNGLDTLNFKADSEKRNLFREVNNIPPDAVVIGMAAVISPVKGQLNFVGVFNSICQKHPNVYLYFAGRYADNCPGYIEEFKAATAYNKRIVYLGFVDNMVSFYNGCDIIVSNSVNEPLGTNIYEAMACEKIVLASNSGGTKEIITDERDGYLFETASDKVLFQKIDYILTNYNKLEYIKTAGRKRVKKQFDILDMVVNYNKILFKKDRTPNGYSVY